MKKPSGQELPRRQLLRMGVTVTAASFLAGGVDLALPFCAHAQSTLTPNVALDQLVAGNKRFTSGRLTAYDQDLTILKQHTEEKQEPFAAVLSCADSRVPVELRFRSEHRAYFCNQDRREHDNARNHRQPGIRRRGFGN